MRQAVEDLGVVLGQTAEVLEGQGYGLEEVLLALEDAAVDVGSEGLEDAQQEVGPEVVEPAAPFVALDAPDAEVVVQELAADGLGEVGLGAVEDGGHVVLRRAAAGALEVDIVKRGLTPAPLQGRGEADAVSDGRIPSPLERGWGEANHDVPRLEVAVEEVVGVGLEEKVGEALEVVLEELFVEGDMGELEVVVLEIVEVPEDGLAVEVGAGVGVGEVEVGAGLLDGGEVGEGLLVEGEHLGVESPTLPLLLVQEAVEREVAEVLLEVAALVGGHGVKLRHGDAFGAEMAVEGEECAVLAEVVADGADGGEGSQAGRLRSIVRGLAARVPLVAALRRQAVVAARRALGSEGEDFGTRQA